ncbi:MAG: hypothetical protein JNL64_15415 [Blastocatellia bacterium]|nr:hypothetical protein [Blastocatellia bacterium]
MSDLTIDFQDVIESCPHCEERFTVSRGSVYDNGKGASIYLAALHECGGFRTAHVAIAVKEGYGDFTETCAASLQIVNAGTECQMALVDPEYSPWKDLDYLGRLLYKEELGSLKEAFFHIADQIVTQNPTINTYLSQE